MILVGIFAFLFLLLYIYIMPNDGIWNYTEAADNTIIITGTTESNNLGQNIPHYTLTIPSQIDGQLVTALGNNVFKDFISIRTVSLPITITTIGENCFRGCTDLSIINLSHITSIGDTAFYLCSSLQNIYLTSIETAGLSGACFQGCSSLINITLSNNLTTIPSWAFAACTSVDVLTIPNLVTSIGESCFFNCNKLTSLSLGEGVTSIGINAFRGCALVDVFMPPHLTIDNIGDGAFLAQSDKFKITMPNEYVQNPTDFDKKFQKDSWLPYYIFDVAEGGILTQDRVNELALNWGITKSQLDALTEILGIVVYIDSSVTSISSDAFLSMGYINTVYIGRTVTSIGSSAFSGQSYLQNFYVSDDINSVFNSSLTTIESDAFLDCTSLSILIIPTSVTSIENNAFSGCTGLNAVISYNGSELETIGTGAFQNCTSLAIIRLPNTLITIGTSAFEGCNSLINLLIPDTVKTIKGYAFASCVLLTNVTIPENIQDISNNAFENCRALSIVKNISYHFKPNLANIFNMNESQEFWEYHKKYVYWRSQVLLTESLTVSANAILASGMGEYNLVKNQLGYFSSSGPLVYSVNGVLLYRNARDYISQGNAEIWVNASHGYAAYVYSMSATTWATSWLQGYQDHVTPFTQYENENYILMDAQHSGPTQLIPASYIYRVNISSSTEMVLTKDMVNSIIGTVDQNIELSVTIVDSEDNKIVTIGNEAFTDYQTHINAITFSSKITEIQEKAFQGCTSLKGKITLPESMVLIADRAFQNCTNITSVYLPKNITTINWSAFNNTGLTNVLLFNNRVAIGGNAFTSCTNLANVTAPPPPSTDIPTFYSNWSSSGDIFNRGDSGTTNSGSINFSHRVYFTPDSDNNITKAIVSGQNSDWNSLDFIAYIADVSGSDTPIHIASDAFTGSSITKLFITGTTHKIIDLSAFDGCSKLTYISLSDSVQSIGPSAFINCPLLTSVTIPSRLHSVCNTTYFSDPNEKLTYNFFCILSPSSDGILTSYDVNTQIETSPDFKQPVTITFDSTVTSIENNAFNGNENIVSLIIPPNVTSIGEYAFANCPNLTSVVCAPNSTLIFIYDYAFHNCPNLTTVNIPFSLEVIGVGAFISCSNLWTVTLPYLFNCDSLTQSVTYFEATSIMPGESWTSNDPTDAAGTFFTFNFEHANGLFTSYSYAKDKYIQSQWTAYEKLKEANRKKNEIWNDIGYAALSLVIVGLSMTGIGAVVDTFFAADATALMAEEGAIYGETAEAGVEESGFEYNHPGRQMARARKLQTYKASMLKNTVANYAAATTIPTLIPINLSVSDKSPFQFSPLQQEMYGTSPSVYITHKTGSYTITTIMNTNRFDINLSELESEVNNQIVTFLNDKYSQGIDSTTLSIVHQNPTQYEITITLEDVNYDEITDSDKSGTNEFIQGVLAPYENRYYLAGIIPSNNPVPKNITKNKRLSGVNQKLSPGLSKNVTFVLKKFQGSKNRAVNTKK